VDVLVYVLQQAINGLTLGSIYALTAIGLSMVYSLLRLINFAHGDLLMIGAFASLALGQGRAGPLSYAAAILIPLAAVALLGMGIERVAYRPIRKTPEVTALIVSLAVSVIIQNLFVMTVTAQPRRFALPEFLTRIEVIGPLIVSRTAMLTVASAAVLLLLLQVFVTRIRLGIAMRACADDVDAVELMGADSNRVIMAAFGIAGALAAVGGIMLGGLYGRIDPFMGFLPGLKAFVAAVLGGLGSLPGAMLGAYVLGFAEIFFVGMLPPVFSGFRDAMVFALLILILLIRPQGLLGSRG
jgi:branched-chain amino acid transport system permease protein